MATFNNPKQLNYEVQQYFNHCLYHSHFLPVLEKRSLRNRYHSGKASFRLNGSKTQNTNKSIEVDQQEFIAF